MKPIYKLSLFILISIFLMITFSCKEAEIEFVDASNPSVQLEKNEISAISGESFTISVTAKVNDEGTLTYQWYRNDENSNSTGTRLAGKTESTFTTSYNLENGELEKIFYYYVVVTNTNNNVNGQKKASATSNLVKVTIMKDDSSGSDGNTDAGGENQGDGNTDTGDENQGDGNTDTGDDNQGDGNTSTGDENQGDGNTSTGDDNQGDGSTGTGDENQGDGSTDTGDGTQGDGNTDTGGENQEGGNTDIGDGNQGDGNTDTGGENQEDVNTGTGDETQGDGNTSTGGENQGDGNTSTGDENQGDGNTSTGGENQGDGNTDTGDETQGDGNTSTGGENQGDGNTSTGDENQGDGNTSTGGENQGDGNTSTGGENQGDGNTDTGDETQGDGNTSTGGDNQGDGNTVTGGENQEDVNTGTGDENQGDGNTGTGDDNDTETKPDYEISEKSGVMLQGFNWSSAKRGAGYYKENPSPYWYKWYEVIENQSEAISTKFAYLWCPPPSATDTASSEGYAPTELNNLNNCYGTEDDLTAMIQAIKPTKAIADIVVNHRAGSTSWGDFTNPTWGVIKGSNYAAICSDDEGFTGEPSLMGKATKRGAADTGDGYAAYRDLDHTNTTVQQGIVDWMNDVLKPAGFVGWRYDYVKGFSGKYVGQYNAGSNAEFSVGEYWPTAGYSSGNPSAWGNEIKNWISATANGGQKSKAFDFALKGAMNTVFGNNASNVTNSNYPLLANTANLIMSQPEDAVTFVDNHDTGSTQKHWYLDPADVGTAYAFILTHPGYPCVAWQHYFTYAESGSIVDPEQYIGGSTVPGTSSTYREHIDYLIDLRNRVGIEYDDKVVTTGTTSSCYVGEIVGNNGTLLVKIGNVTAATETGYAGNNPIYSGTNFAIWEKDVDGDATLGGNGSSGSGGGDVSTGDVTLTVTGPDWTWNSTSIFCWAWNDSSDGAWYSCTGSGSTINANVPSDAQYFLIVRCYYGSSVPDWNITSGDVVGRIYNKTADITITSGQTSYSVTFVDYP